MKLKVLNYYPFSSDLSTLNFSGPVNEDLSRGNSKVYKVTYTDGTSDLLTGFGFKFDSEGTILAGTVKSYTHLTGGLKLFSMTNLDLPAAILGKASQTSNFADDRRAIVKALAKDDVFYGSYGTDNFNGYDGNDILYGRDGGDHLEGGKGKDLLYGGRGRDILEGGGGADIFLYKSTGDSLTGSIGQDIISGFSRIEGDKIDLSAIDADREVAGNQAFIFKGKAEFTGTAGELRIEVVTSGYGEYRYEEEFIQGDINGDGKEDFEIEFTSFRDLISSDFIL